MKINEMDNVSLVKNLGFWRAIRIFYLCVCIFFCVVAIISFGIPIQYVIPIGLIVTVIVTLLFSIPIKRVEREIASRQQSGEEFANRRNVEKKATKNLLIFMIIAGILAGIYAVKLWGGVTSGYDQEEKCKNCGRTTDIVPGFEYCEDCYDGFVDWQEDNWKDD